MEGERKVMCILRCPSHFATERTHLFRQNFTYVRSQKKFYCPMYFTIFVHGINAVQISCSVKDYYESSLYVMMMVRRIVIIIIM